MQGDDTELAAAVIAAQRGDELAFGRLYRALQPRLLGYVRTIVAERDAEDVTSETWLHISRDLGRFQGDADRFRGWTARIARNRALDHVRACGRRPVELAGDLLVEDRPSRADTAEAAIESIATSHALALVRRLPREQAEAVVLRTVLGLDARRAALLLGCRPGAVRTATHRGLRRLAGWVDGTAESPVSAAESAPPAGRARSALPRVAPRAS